MDWLVTIYKKSGYFKVDLDMVMGLGLKLVIMHTPSDSNLIFNLCNIDISD